MAYLFVVLLQHNTPLFVIHITVKDSQGAFQRRRVFSLIKYKKKPKFADLLRKNPTFAASMFNSKIKYNVIWRQVIRYVTTTKKNKVFLDILYYAKIKPFSTSRWMKLAK